MLSTPLVHSPRQVMHVVMADSGQRDETVQTCIHAMTTDTGKRIIRVALLLCDTPITTVQAEFGSTYLPIFRAVLLKSLASFPDRALVDDVELELDGYDAVKGQYPPRDRLTGPGGYDAVMLTGSSHTAAEAPFVTPLAAFLHALATDRATEHVKQIGICFGHQVLAIAFGGQCGRSENGWEVGVYRVQLSDAGRDILGDGADGPRVYIQQMHRDVVQVAPESFTLLGTTAKCSNQGMVKHYPNGKIHILTFQGHPEFTPRIVNLLTDRRHDQGIFDDATEREARRRAGGRGREGGEGGEGEGVGRLGWAIWNVLLGVL